MKKKPIVEASSAVIFSLLFLSPIVLSSCGGRDRYTRESLQPFFPRGKTWFSSRSNDAIPVSNEAGERGLELASLEIDGDWIFLTSERRGLTVLHQKYHQVKFQSDPKLGGSMSDALFDNGKVFAIFQKGFLVAYDFKNGTELWRYELNTPIVSKPYAHQGRVFVTTPDDVTHALDIDTGKLLWAYKRKGGGGNTTVRIASPRVIQGVLWVGTSEGSVIGLQIETGDVVFEKRLASTGKFLDVDSTPVWVGDTAFIQVYDGSLYALKTSDRGVRWVTEDGGSRSIVPLKSGDLLVSLNSGKIKKIDAKTGRTLWSFELDGGSPTEARLFEDEVIVGSSHRYLYALRLSDGKLLRRFDFGSQNGMISNPEVSQDKTKFFVLSTAGNLYEFKKR